MTFARSIAGVVFALTLTASPGAGAASTVRTCVMGAETRTIEVMTPGIVGAACDLRLTYGEGGEARTPYHANNSEGFCAEKAREMISALTREGFACAPSTLDASAAQRPRPVDVPPSPEDIGKILSAGAGAAPGDPVQLTSASAVARAVRQPTQSAVGRLVGAEPDPEPEERPAYEPGAAKPGAKQDAPPAEEKSGPAEAAGDDAAAPRSAPTAAARVRPTADLIRRVLAAQAAAWNEGDLDAFMGGYWKSPDLRFVSGTQVTRGWAPTMKRYRERYGEADLGRLAFDKLEVEFVTDEVAVVVGRFDLKREAGDSSGTFTLVMKAFNGAWRIVHDHTTADAETPTEQTPR